MNPAFSDRISTFLEHHHLSSLHHLSSFFRHVPGSGLEPRSFRLQSGTLPLHHRLTHEIVIVICLIYRTEFNSRARRCRKVAVRIRFEIGFSETLIEPKSDDFWPSYQILSPAICHLRRRRVKGFHSLLKLFPSLSGLSLQTNPFKTP